MANIPCNGTHKACGKPATHSAYDGKVFYCDECLHYVMEDASPEEQESVVELEKHPETKET
jgi:hypothetical protein